MKYVVAVVLMFLAIFYIDFVHAGVFTWVKANPSTGITYTTSALYCGGLKVGSVKSSITRLATSATSLKPTGTYSCYLKTQGYSNNDSTKKILESIASNTVIFNMTNGVVKVNKLYPPSGLGIR